MPMRPSCCSARVGQVISPHRFCLGEAGAPYHRLHGRQLRQRHFAAQRHVLPREVRRKNHRAEPHGHHPQHHMAPDRLTIPAPQRHRQPQHHEGQQQRVHVPAQKQRHARLPQQLPEPPFGGEHRHAVKDQHQAEQVDHTLRGDHVVVAKRVVRGECQQGRRQRGPAVAHQSAQGEVSERRRGGEEDQHQHPRCEQPCGHVTGKGQHDELDQHMPEHGETVVRYVGAVAVGVRGQTIETEKVVFRGQVSGHRHVIQLIRGPVKVTAVTAEEEHRRQRQEQQGERRRRGAPPFAAAEEDIHRIPHRIEPVPIFRSSR